MEEDTAPLRQWGSCIVPTLTLLCHQFLGDWCLPFPFPAGWDLRPININNRIHRDRAYIIVWMKNFWQEM